MLKTIVLPEMLTSNKLMVIDNENSIGDSSDSMKHAKKSGKSKVQKLSKS